mmetsp:Transcript_104088/g.294389  ORF Transcript_104088/g.294389 Transcript_104088/m.294389 type:complete len:333 (-) Transcript_104088:21-1019(-)
MVEHLPRAVLPIHRCDGACRPLGRQGLLRWLCQCPWHRRLALDVARLWDPPATGLASDDAARRFSVAAASGVCDSGSAASWAARLRLSDKLGSRGQAGRRSGCGRWLHRGLLELPPPGGGAIAWARRGHRRGGLLRQRLLLWRRLGPAHRNDLRDSPQRPDALRAHGRRLRAAVRVPLPRQRPAGDGGWGPLVLARGRAGQARHDEVREPHAGRHRRHGRPGFRTRGAERRPWRSWQGPQCCERDYVLVDLHPAKGPRAVDGCCTSPVRVSCQASRYWGIYQPELMTICSLQRPTIGRHLRVAAFTSRNSCCRGWSFCRAADALAITRCHGR